MKKRLHDQKAGIAILSVLIIVSLLEVVFRLADISVGLYNIAFNTPAVLPAGIEVSVFKKQIMLDVFNKAYHVVMIFLFAFFAYDSAKRQLSKTKLS